MQALKVVHSYEVNVLDLCKLLHYPKKQQLKTSSRPQASVPSSVPLQGDKDPQNIDIPHLFHWICGLWSAAVKHFIADSTWLIGILDEWAQNRFVNKWTISRLPAPFLNQGKHNLIFHFFNWEKTLLRLIGIYLWYSFNRKVSGISAHDLISPSIQDLSF